MQEFANYMGMSVFSVYLIFIIVIIWCLIWKGIALWKSARHNDLTWFIVLLIINTMGILEIIYIFVFAKREYKKEKIENSKPELKNK